MDVIGIRHQFNIIRPRNRLVGESSIRVRGLNDQVATPLAVERALDDLDRRLARVDAGLEEAAEAAHVIAGPVREPHEPVAQVQRPVRLDVVTVVDKARGVLHRVAHEGQAQGRELAVQPGLNAAEHGVQAIDDVLRVVEEREQIKGGREVGRDDIEAGEAAVGIEPRADVQDIVRVAVGVGVQRGAAHGQAGGREEDRQVD